MKTSTICEIDAVPREGLQYWGGGGRALFTRTNSVHPRMTEFTRDGVLSFYDLHNVSPLSPWDEDIKTTENAFGHGIVWDQPQSAVRHDTPSSEWLIEANRRLTDWQETASIRVGHQIGDLVQAFERPLYSTATDAITVGTYSSMSLGSTYHANEIFYLRKLLEDAFRRSTALIYLTELNPDPTPGETLTALERIKELPDNWDGDGASRIDEKTVEKAQQLIREAFSAAADKLKPPSIAPGFGGMIVAEWSGPEGRELILDIHPGDEAPGFLLVEHSPDGEEIETDEELGSTWSMRDLIVRLAGN